MITEVKVETCVSARARGFRFVRSDGVAVVSVSSERSGANTPLRAVLQACVERFHVILRTWLAAIPMDHVLLFATTPISDKHNAITRRRGIWGIDGLRWLPPAANRSPSVEVAGREGGSRFVGLAEVGEAFFDATDFVRTIGGSFLLVSPRGELTEERVVSLAAKVFPKGHSSIDWAGVVALVEEGEDICVRASGGFDDREASLDIFLSNELLQRIGAS